MIKFYDILSVDRWYDENRVLTKVFIKEVGGYTVTKKVERWLGQGKRNPISKMDAPVGRVQRRETMYGFDKFRDMGDIYTMWYSRILSVWSNYLESNMVVVELE